MTSADSHCGEWRGSDFLLRVRLQARASRDEVVGVENGMLRVRTTAAPVDNDANKKAARLLADYLQVPPSSVALLRGQKHRNKQFLISGLSRIPPVLTVVRAAPNA